MEKTVDEEGNWLSGENCGLTQAKLHCAEFVNVHSKRAQTPDIGLMTDRILAESLNLAELLEIWINTVREAANCRLLAEVDSVPGWKLVSGSYRQWNDNATTKLPELLGDNAYKPPQLIGILEAEKLLDPKTMNQLTQKKERKPKLVRR